MMYHSDMRRSIERESSRAFIWFTLLLGFLLNLLPYPDHWFEFKPDFVALLLVYWALRVRKPISLTLAFTLGVLMDVAYTAALGQHAFAYAVLLGVTTVFRSTYVIATRLQQVCYVGIALAAGIASSLAVSMWLEGGTPTLADFQPALVGAGIWLVLPLLLTPAARFAHRG